MHSFNYIHWCVVLFISMSTVHAALQCRDENNSPVDWFLLYKVPDFKGIADDNGTSYMFITPKSLSKGWTLSSRTIGSLSSIPAFTLAPLYNRSIASNIFWILYNDQPPEGESKSGGHSKGVLGADISGGFWLVHSVPNFPPPPKGGQGRYEYPSTGLKNGQSFLCLSIPKDQIDNVGIQLQYNQIEIFWKNLSTAAIQNQYPQLAAAANGARIRRSPFNNLVTIKTIAGNEFHSFAKTSRFRKDIYEDWLAPELKSDLYVETWLNGRGPLASNCTRTYKVQNVDEIKLCEVSQCTKFSSTKDHSKWAVTTNKNNPWLCVGDINRAASQERRGGGTVCWRNEMAWEAYYKSVASVKPCARKPGKNGLFQNASVVLV